jgi:ParB family chromosome partitioning protein
VQQTRQKPQLRSLDDLFLIEAGNEKAPQGDTEYAIVDFGLMDSYPNHQFRLYEGRRKEDMTESIRQNGILQPLILRAKNDGRYTILAGHNRKICGMDAGLPGGPAVVKRGLSDDEAKLYVIETNLMQRGFSEMLPSERAAVLAAYHSKLFSQGKRRDIIAELQTLESTGNSRANPTFAEFRKGFRTRETLAEEYGLSPNQIALYLRADKLIGPLKKRLDRDEFALSAASNLSFLTVPEQQAVDKCMELNGFKADMRKSDLLREYSVGKKLGEENIYLVLSGEAGRPSKKNRAPAVKVRKAVYARYFKPEQSAGEIQNIVEKALEMYFSARETL